MSRTPRSNGSVRLGYEVIPGPVIAPGELAAERSNYSEAILSSRLRVTLQRPNPHLPPDALEDAYRKLTTPDAPSLVGLNRRFHRMLVEGIEVEYRRPDGSIAGDRAWPIDFNNPDNNDWLAVNQFTVTEAGHTRRADIVLFVNGLPLAVIELKNAADENADHRGRLQPAPDLQAADPSLFAFNEALVISDGLHARIGTISADRERFMPWRTIEGEELAPPRLPQLEVLLKGVFDKRRFLDLMRYCIVFEDEGAAQSSRRWRAITSSTR